MAGNETEGWRRLERALTTLDERQSALRRGIGGFRNAIGRLRHQIDQLQGSALGYDHELRQMQHGLNGVRHQARRLAAIMEGPAGRNDLPADHTAPTLRHRRSAGALVA